jgi:2-oxoisovalerate dehydrogenase E1 component
VIDTYRFSPHSKGDDVRDPAEIEARRNLDPLAVAGRKLPGAERRAVEKGCEHLLAETLQAAERAPAATPGASR